MKKKTLSLILYILLTVSAAAQSVTLTFTGRDMKNHWLLLDRVEVSNLSNVWQEILYWSDTVLTMQNGTDIEEISSNSSLVLWQNRPNPSRYY